MKNRALLFPNFSLYSLSLCTFVPDNDIMAKKIFLIGAGRSATTLIKYL
ncbi:MAG: hypothetical protein ACJAZ3_000351, partial [Sphingobacteriales bacterium]